MSGYENLPYLKKVYDGYVAYICPRCNGSMTWEERTSIEPFLKCILCGTIVTKNEVLEKIRKNDPKRRKFEAKRTGGSLKN